MAKARKKAATNKHIDKNSHNVKINVMSESKVEKLKMRYNIVLYEKKGEGVNEHLRPEFICGQFNALGDAFKAVNALNKDLPERLVFKVETI